MKLSRPLLPMLMLASLPAALSAQHCEMPGYDIGRGYYNAPYYRYEAEHGYCRGYDATPLDATDDQRLVQSEASNQTAMMLARDGYVEWLNDSGDADGINLRYSIPDGTTATVAVFVGDENLGELTLDTAHSWQYCQSSGDGSRTNKPEKYSRKRENGGEGDIVRMRFDERHRRLSRDILTGERFSLRNMSDTPVTVDFVEIEKTEKTDAPAGAAVYHGNGSDLYGFIRGNLGRTIYIPEGEYVVGEKIDLNGAENTVVKGAGMWYTHIHFSNYGLDTTGFNNDYSNNCVEDMCITSCQNQRYHPATGPYRSPGKAFTGDWGTTDGNRSTIANVWVEHFECGAWIANYSGGSGANGLTIRGCRFRNNYADGINLCRGAKNCVVEYCSFRNNGDDDMASWSADGYTCHNNTYRYCTAEHNWRASSLGFFGGHSHEAHNLLIKDGLESGMRLVSDFGGSDFSGGNIAFHDITIVHCGCTSGREGEAGDFWGVDEGALHVEASANYDIVAPTFSDIDIHGSRGNAVFIGSSGHSIKDMRMDRVYVHGVPHEGSYGYYFENAIGNGSIHNPGVATADKSRVTNHSDRTLSSGQVTANGSSFMLTGNGLMTGIKSATDGGKACITVRDGMILVSGEPGEVSVYDMNGIEVFNGRGNVVIDGLDGNFYVVKAGDASAKVMLR